MLIPIAGGATSTPLNLAKRMGVIARAVPLAGARVLDLGCGRGDYVEAMLARGADAWGVEYSAEKVGLFDANRAGGARVVQGDITALDWPAASVDAALLNEVLEHVPDDRAALREARRVLRPGGTLVVFSPNRLYPFESHGTALAGGRKVPAHVPFVSYLPARLFRPWARNYWPWELRRLVREAGFTIRSTGYVWQTFEGITKRPPWVVRHARGTLRRLAGALERVPGVRAFGVSQVIVAEAR